MLAGIRFESVESLEGLNPISFDADVTIEPGRTLSADTTSFSNLNGLTIPTGPGTVALLSNIAGSGTVLEAVSDDPAPILGGNLSPDQYKIKNLSYGRFWCHHRTKWCRKSRSCCEQFSWKSSVDNL